MSTYKLVFRGDLAPGHNFMTVRQQVQDLFRLDDDGINKLFCGRPVTIKKNLDKAAAAKWQEMLLRAGAAVEILPEQGAKESPDVARQQDADWLVEPPGSDVLKPGERTAVSPVDVDTDRLSVDVPGADVLRPEERQSVEELNLDLSHLSVADLEK
jgi:hypothetical protein